MSNLMLLGALFRSTSTSLINNMIRWMGGRLQVKTDRWLRKLGLSRYIMLDYIASTGGDCQKGSIKVEKLGQGRKAQSR